MNKRIRKKKASRLFWGKFEEPMLFDWKGNSIPLASVKTANGVIVGDPFAGNGGEERLQFTPESYLKHFERRVQSAREARE